MVIKNRMRNIRPVIMGGDAYPVIVSNVGVSSLSEDFFEEQKKAIAAVNAGADIISDLSMARNVESIHNWYVENIDKPVSCVSIYETFLMEKPISEDRFIRVFEEQAKRGIDIITLHATVFRGDIELIKESNRLIPSTSRGGAMVLDCLWKGSFENPYYSYFDEILKIAKKYNVCLSLGPAFRPASVWDCANHNELHLIELKRMSKLTEQAKREGVGIAVEGIGHAPINLIPSLVRYAKEICQGAAYRVLTVSTDIAMGFDHISSAISSAIAVQYGADSITCVTRNEHIGKPTLNNIVESVKSAKVAAETGYRARKDDFPLDYNVSLARRQMGCHAECSSFLFKELNLSNFSAKGGFVKSCGMCKDYCPFLIIDNILSNR